MDNRHGVDKRPSGLHVILDLWHLEYELCTDTDLWLRSFESIAEALGMTVIAKNGHLFQPPREPGMTAYVLLDASHFSVHTYADWGIAAVDLFACRRDTLAPAVADLCKALDLKQMHIREQTEVHRFA